MKTIFKYLAPSRLTLIITTALLFGQAWADLALPDLMSDIVNTGILMGGGQSYIIAVGLKMIIVALAGIIPAILIGFYSAKISTSVAKKLRHDIFKKVSSFSSAEFNKFSTASLITRTTNDIQQVQMLIMMGIRIVCYAPIMAIGGIIFALNKSINLSWIIAVSIIILIGLIAILFALGIPKSKLLQKLIDKLNLVSRENLSGMLVIRAFGNEVFEEKRFEEANKDLYKTNLFVQRIVASMTPIVMLIMNVISITIVWVGGHAIANSTLQIGDMIAFMQYAMQIIMSFVMLSMMLIMLPRAIVSAERISEVLNTISIIKNPENPESLGKVKGKITFNNVSFRYDNAEEEILVNISLTANPGETTAFIGSTGSGKSTLVNLIPRFYDVTKGSVEIDGIDIRNIPQVELRENIGYVPQKGILFSGNIEKNIAYGKENINEDEVYKVIEVAQAKEFIEKFEEKLKHPISQGGDNVSGGQKQRLSIARALYKNPPIYIFDDSFSALDYKTDTILRKELKKYTQNATVLIVATRISTIINAEQIVVLDNGKIVGIGTHNQLIKNCKEYIEIAESQLSKEELA